LSSTSRNANASDATSVRAVPEIIASEYNRSINELIDAAWNGDTRKTALSNVPVSNVPFSDRPLLSRAHSSSSETQLVPPPNLSPPNVQAMYPKTPGRSLNVKRVPSDSGIERETPVAKRLRTKAEIGKPLDALREYEGRFETPESDLYE
jgi:hypothetical protein